MWGWSPRPTTRPSPLSLWISTDFQWIWVDFLHVDSHLYLYYLQGISRRQVLVVVQDSAHPPFAVFYMFLIIRKIILQYTINYF